MDVLVRYSELQKKKGKTRQQLVQALRQKIQDKLDFEDLDYGKVSERPGRILIFNSSKKAAEKISLLPGVQSCSPAVQVETDIEILEENLPRPESSFGVRVNTRDTDFSSQKLEKRFGSVIKEDTGEEVDLETPGTWVKVEITKDYSHIFTETFDGNGGLPAATQGNYLTLISGGIDSPVAAYQMMKRGADITPIYFYNRPYAAEDHMVRFEKCIERLREFYPGKKWSYYIVDMGDVNEKLRQIGKGRMILHRRIMFEVADGICKEEGLNGLVTGESLSQKSSQTPRNLETTSGNLHVLRPLITWNKDEITQFSRKLGLFEYSKIDSACRSLSPNSPSTNLTSRELESLKKEIGFDSLVQDLIDSVEKRTV